MTPMERIEGELSDAQKRIAELERRNVGLDKECQAQQEQITELKNALTRQAKAAQQGMDAAKAAAHTLEQNAARMYAQCSPAALESEREANARLTSELEKVQAERDALAAKVEAWKEWMRRDPDPDETNGEWFDEGWYMAKESPYICILRRDLIKQAEALKTVASKRPPGSAQRAWLLEQADDYLRQAGELSK